MKGKDRQQMRLTVSGNCLRWIHGLRSFRVALGRFRANEFLGMFDGIGGGRELFIVGLASGADSAVED